MLSHTGLRNPIGLYRIVFKRWRVLVESLHPKLIRFTKLFCGHPDRVGCLWVKPLNPALNIITQATCVRVQANDFRHIGFLESM